MSAVYPSVVELRVFVYPTEERERVVRALLNLIPASLRREAKQESSLFKSHYGYKTEEIRLSVKGSVARETAEHIHRSMDRLSLENMMSALGRRVSGNSLYLRLDRQEALSGRIKLHEAGSGGQIGVKITYSSVYLPKNGLIQAIRERGFGRPNEALRGP